MIKENNIKSSRNLKIKEVEKLKEMYDKSKVVVITEYRGLNVKEMTELRKKLREKNTKFKVSKNTLAKRVFFNEENKTIESLLKGPVGLAFGLGELVEGVKAIKEFTKEHENLKIKGGILEGKILTANDIKIIADLPSREILIAKVATGMKAPISGLVFTLKGIINKFVYTLESIKVQKGGK